jgi:putative tryptophan/tyrosine transport system substrate-binding protein
MRRREFIALIGASVTWPFAALAQEAGRTYRLGCLWAVPRGDDPAYKAFFDELRRRGFVEGQNLTVEFRAYGQHVDLIPQYAVELVKARVDVHRSFWGSSGSRPSARDENHSDRWARS